MIHSIDLLGGLIPAAELTVNLADFAALAIALCFGIFVQSAAGFAAGLLIIPLLLWAGYGLPDAMSAMLVATIPQTAWGVWSLRKHVAWRRVTVPALGRIVFIPAGIYTLHLMHDFPPTMLRQIVGGVVLVATLAMLLLRVQPRKRLPIGWSLIAFPLSGFMQGLVGMGGPPLVMWVQAHDWSTKRSRGFLFSMYIVSLGPALFGLYWTFGASILRGCFYAALSTPLLWVATTLGLRVGSMLGRHRLRSVTIALLIGIGLAGLFAPWLRPVGGG